MAKKPTRRRIPKWKADEQQWDEVRTPKSERRCKLLLWMGDGQLAWHDGLGKTTVEVGSVSV